jgi:hypothetical protein
MRQEDTRQLKASLDKELLVTIGGATYKGTLLCIDACTPGAQGPPSWLLDTPAKSVFFNPDGSFVTIEVKAQQPRGTPKELG